MSPGAAASPARFEELRAAALRGFTGGLNIRDAPDELGADESPDLWNVVLDERGGFGSRLGLAKWNSAPYGASPVCAIFEWRKGGHVVVQAGTGLYLDSATVPFKTLSSNARCGFAEFAGKLWIAHPLDGLFGSDGTAGGTAVVATAPKGSALAVWQNRLWLADAVSARLSFSAIGKGDQWTPQQTTTTGATSLPAATITVGATSGFDPTGSIRIGTGAGQQVVTYTGVTPTSFTGCLGGTGSFANGSFVTQGANYNDLIEKDEQPIICLRGASGQDIIGAPGLLAFKRRSAYRITDSDTGAYVTIDPQVGAASNAAAAVVLGRVYTISMDGIAWTDGRGPMRIETDKLRPLWTPEQLAFDHPELWVLGRRKGHIVASVPTVGKTACDLALEHYPGSRPENAATTIGSNAASCYAPLTLNTEKLLSGDPTKPGQVYENGKGGTDDGTPIRAWYQTFWWPVAPERLARIRSAIFEGHGSFTAFVRFDYALGLGDPRNVTIDTGSGFKWDSGWKWNDGSSWGPTVFAGYSQPQPSLGVGRVIGFRIEATTDFTFPAPPVPGTQLAPVRGAWAVYAIHLKTVPLRQL